MKVITIPCAFDNYSFLLICEQTKQAGVVDPAEFYPIWTEIQNQGVDLKAILCTHNHMDYTAGNSELLAKRPDVRVYGFHSDKGSIPGQTDYLADGDEITLGTLTGRVLHTPGHTLGSVCYLFGNAVFTGDTLFASGCGRVFEGTPAQMYDSLNQKIAGCPAGSELYFGHEYTIKNLEFAQTVEPKNEKIHQAFAKVRSMREQGRPTAPSLLSAELATNPFLRCEAEGIKKTVRQHEPANDLSPREVFRVIRQLKDQF